MTTEAAATNAQSAFTSETPPEGFTTADQVKRFAQAKSANAPRVMDIDAVYDGSFPRGAGPVTGANRGIGLALCRELAANGAKIVAVCRKASDELRALNRRRSSRAWT